MDQCRRTNIVWFGGWCTVAVEGAAHPRLRYSKSSPSPVADDAVVRPVVSPSLDATSPKVVERICLGRAVVGRVLFGRVDVGIRGLRLRWLSCGRRLDLGEHIVVAVPSSTVSIGHLAHVWREHWSLGRLHHDVRLARMIRRRRIHPRWGNHRSAHPHNRPSRRRRSPPRG